MRGPLTPPRPTRSDGKGGSLPRIWCLAVCVVLLSSGAQAGPDARLAQELRLRAAAQKGDRVALEALLSAPTVDPVRARALWEFYRGAHAPLSSRDRARLLAALADASPEVRRAALRAVGETGERTLEREALRRAAEDPEPEVRVEALRAVRRWSRQGHLYFLEEAMGAPAVEVRIAALQNLARLAYREVAPVLVDRVRGLAGGGDPYVRGAALEVLRAWDRLEWEVLADAIEDRSAPEALRVQALELADALGEGGADREAAWLQALDSDPSFRLAWECFRRLESSGVGRSEVAPPVARLLMRYPYQNAATNEMAAFLSSRGYRVEYRTGAWSVSAR